MAPPTAIPATPAITTTAATKRQPPHKRGPRQPGVPLYTSVRGIFTTAVHRQLRRRIDTPYAEIPRKNGDSESGDIRAQLGERGELMKGLRRMLLAFVATGALVAGLRGNGWAGVGRLRAGRSVSGGDHSQIAAPETMQSRIAAMGTEQPATSARSPGRLRTARSRSRALCSTALAPSDRFRSRSRFRPVTIRTQQTHSHRSSRACRPSSPVVVRRCRSCHSPHPLIGRRGPHGELPRRNTL